MGRMQLVSITAFVALIAIPLDSSADVVLTVTPDFFSVAPSTTVSMTLYMTTDVGTETDNATWSLGCNSGCTLRSFTFIEAFAPGSGFVTWGANKNHPPFAAGGTQTNLNTSGSLAGQGDGLGTVIGGGSTRRCSVFSTSGSPGTSP